MNVVYEVELRLDGEFVGNVRQLAQSLVWTRKRTRKGVDSISFSLNDKLFAEWLAERTQKTIDEVLRPYALDCRIVRNGEAMVGGYLATKPGYSPNGTSATLNLNFDGYLNLLAGVYIAPTATQTARMDVLVSNYIQMAETRSTAAGKAFGFVAGSVENLPQITHTFDSYKSVKEFISDRCDNTSGAGQFDVYFHENRVYDIVSDKEFGVVRDYKIQYPTRQSGVSAMSISAGEVSGFASRVIGVGEGVTSADSENSTALISEITDNSAVATYGYCERLLNESSISQQATLNAKVEAEMKKAVNPDWQPQLALTGVQITPSPKHEGTNIWVGDTVEVKNDMDLLGATSGIFRVMELSVAVSATNAETITPVLERAKNG